ncbi:low temperature requirement protein A [Micromonospora sp. WMMD812]|uniref:low temperature requirement protein A n=1 Tax=Micromonospora sp. WMMD812 TaxID=3015152 RepID=UPI00248AAE52|nr:low temperature requirement protein A [Micromonospora sp. WMMD812]WBB70274.1 low temperature requirement protein A [Micromonospora sp. WMMD812]
MTTANGVGLLRGGVAEPQRATFLELFFDLVFVFALTRVSQRLMEDLTGGRQMVLPAVGQTTLLLLALWLVWTNAAWVTSRYDPRRLPVQLIMIGLMFASMIMALGVSGAWDDRGLIFAVAYVVAQVGRPAAFLLVLRGRERRIPARLVCWHSATGGLWIVGALVPEAPVGGALWTLALAIEYAGLVLGWPTPGLGRSPITRLAIASEHLAERYGQFVLVALGESILLTGVTFDGGRFGVGQTTAFVVAFATTVLLWRIYFFGSRRVIPRAMTAGPGAEARIGAVGGYGHLAMVAGILATAVGYELVIRHPSGHLDPAWLGVILGGPALFLAGGGMIEYYTLRRPHWSMVAGLVVLIALAPVVALGPPLAAAVVAVAALAGIAVADAIRPPATPRAEVPPPS